MLTKLRRAGWKRSAEEDAKFSDGHYEPEGWTWLNLDRVIAVEDEVTHCSVSVAIGDGYEQFTLAAGEEAVILEHLRKAGLVSEECSK